MLFDRSGRREATRGHGPTTLVVSAKSPKWFDRSLERHRARNGQPRGPPAGRRASSIVVIHGKQDQGNAAEEEMLEEEGPDSPLLDLSDVAVKELIRGAKKRGYVTDNQVNALLSSEEVKSVQNEDILVQLISEIPRPGSGKIIRYKLRKLIKGESVGLAA